MFLNFQAFTPHHINLIIDVHVIQKGFHRTICSSMKNYMKKVHTSIGIKHVTQVLLTNCTWYICYKSRGFGSLMVYVNTMVQFSHEWASQQIPLTVQGCAMLKETKKPQTYISDSSVLSYHVNDRTVKKKTKHVWIVWKVYLLSE